MFAALEMAKCARILKANGRLAYYLQRHKAETLVRLGTLRKISPQEYIEVKVKESYVPSFKSCSFLRDPIGKITSGYRLALDQSEYVRRRQARSARADGFHTKQQWQWRIAFYGWHCKYCNMELNLNTVTKDHQIPLVEGGSHWPANLVPACKSCNSWKGSRKIRTLGS